MHVFSLIAPQQPKNAMTNTTTPATISRIGNADKVPSKIHQKKYHKNAQHFIISNDLPRTSSKSIIRLYTNGPTAIIAIPIALKMLKCQLNHCFCTNYNFFLISFDLRQTRN